MDNNKGFLQASVYQKGISSPLGHLDFSEPTPVWRTLNICPTGLTNEKLLSVVGKGRGLSFTVQIAESASEIMLDEPRTVNVQRNEVSVFQFIPPQGISDKQLDITATSQSNLAAYLKVSQTCEDVSENLQVVDYKKKSLRLSFATKGRFTLSKVSVPPLTDSVSRWFIGIGLKNISGDVKVKESKNVTLKLTRSFNYSYASPICALFFASFGVGILVSLCAFFLFKGSLVDPADEQFKTDTCNFSCCDLWEVIKDHWFSFGPKTYSYITGIVGNVLIVGAFQFVFANWYTMIQEGDRDNCYYNDFCYRVVSHDIPFNLMISNLSYIIHGLILAVWVLIMETKLLLLFKSHSKEFQKHPKLPEHVLSCPETNFHLLEKGIPELETQTRNNTTKTLDEEKKILEKRRIFFAEVMKKRYCFSIGYAFSWALVFEGLFSTLYHLCPSRFTFQFDSAFMFIIAGLTVLLLYNGREQDRCPDSANVKYPVGASNFFLFFIVPLFIFNYFGSLYNSDSGASKVLQGFFIGFLFIWWLVMILWAFFKLNIRDKIKSCCQWESESICNVFLFILGALVPCGLFMIYWFGDLAQVFLFACIACSAVAVLAKAKLCNWEKDYKCNCSAMKVSQGIFIVITVITFVGAFCVFHYKPTTNKTLSPENSRDKNKECTIYGFFDWHDIWHFLSSFALLMGAFVVMFMNSEKVQFPKKAITRRYTV
ncbi:SID1 transmembrane family member 1 [Stylophora pistillata]|uniref:SID1 transmembrane family member 1 n=2 Tax=Stylophora pistillata TaxID=50429 RepID=A0A2B4SVF4_STYPI|nr:SID1 transmembrane family member 1 [Stylophora pistillata]